MKLWKCAVRSPGALLLGGGLAFAAAPEAAGQATERVLQDSGGKQLSGLDLLEISIYQSGKQRYGTTYDSVFGDLDGALGPIFSGTACTDCHGDTAGDGTFLGTRYGAVDVTGAFDPLSDHGGPVLQVAGKSDVGCRLEVVPDGRTLEDGTVLPVANVVAARRAHGSQGYGLIEALDDGQIEANEVVQAGLSSIYGLSGRVHWTVPLDSPDGTPRAGRFGWKATHATVRSATAEAARDQLGLTNVWCPEENLPNGPRLESGAASDCEDPLTGVDPELAAGTLYLETVIAYQRYLTGPPQSPRAGTTGELVFGQLGCALCHVPEYVTPQTPAEGFLRGRTIRPYTDFLLHELVDLDEQGAVLAGRPDGVPAIAPDGTVTATAHEIRTPALWGLRDRPYLMHDGSVDVGALGFDAAIRAVIDHHRGEADFARVAFETLPEADQTALVAFLDTLGRLDLDFDDDGVRDLDDLAPAVAALGAVGADDPEAIADLDGNGVVDSTEVSLLFDQVVAGGLYDDNANRVEDAVDIALGLSEDADGDGVPDEADGSYDCDRDRYWRKGDGGTVPDTSGGGVPFFDSVFVSGVDRPITRVRVTLTGLHHPDASDLTVTLTHVAPGATSASVQLTSGGTGADRAFAGTYLLGDGGARTIEAPDAVHAGTTLLREGHYAVEADPGAFADAFVDGTRTANGEWVLVIQDTADPTTVGGFDGWTLEVTVLDPEPDDSDGDGVDDCSDGCPDDPFLTEPGDCGCGNDADGDGCCDDDETGCGCAGDLDGDGAVGGADLALLLGDWGPCGPGDCAVDLDGSGTVDGADLSLLLGGWGLCP